jgi:nicotinamide-nucleotide amidase
MSASVEIIAVGSELLLGMVQDTNTHWLCREVTGLGGRVVHCSMVPDDLRAIASEIQRALSARPELLITTGGLGPTADDMTLEAVALALGVTVEENAQALSMLENLFRRLAEAKLIERGELNASRRKMARLPPGAIPLANRVGAAPGALVRQGKTLIVSLPGVPAEMQGIWQTSLSPYLKELFGQGFYLEKTLIVDLNDESRIASLLQEVQERWPQVYIKSRPKGFEEGLKIWITVAMRGERSEIEKSLGNVITVLEGRLKSEGFSVEWA